MVINQEMAGNRNGIKDLRQGLLWTSFLTLFFLFLGGNGDYRNLFMALPFFILLYLVLFSIGRDSMILVFRNQLGKSTIRALVFPSILFLLYILYLLINRQDPFKGNLLLAVYLVFFPVAAFALRGQKSQGVGWFDFTVFVLTLVPGALFNVRQPSEIPFGGGGFDSFFHIMVIINGVYAFAVVRGLPGVGFYPVFKWRSLFTAIWVWLAFYALVMAIGLPTGFIRITGYDQPLMKFIGLLIFTMATTFLHTALFEELFFRGILQNLLARRIGQSRSWKIFWSIGFGILLVGAILTGYTLKGSMKWFPAVVTIVLFASAYFIENSGKPEKGIYTSLALTGVTFGLVHYHAGSIIYIGLACVAGWAYGYTYLKTRNVFYSALVHMLVNTSVMMFGLSMTR